MNPRFNFSDALPPAARAAWQIEDALPQGAVLDFARDRTPHPFACIAAIRFLEERERRTPRQIHGHEDLALFRLFPAARAFEPLAANEPAPETPRAFR